MRTDKGEWWLLVGICLLCVFFTYAIVDTAQAVVNVMEHHERVNNRPVKCKEYYNSGTNEWVECMGVGYK